MPTPADSLLQYCGDGGAGYMTPTLVSCTLGSAPNLNISNISAAASKPESLKAARYRGLKPRWCGTDDVS